MDKPFNISGNYNNIKLYKYLVSHYTLQYREKEKVDNKCEPE